MLSSQVRSIGMHEVTIEHAGAVHELPNDAVIVCAGGELPTPLLKQIGIRFETKFGTQ